MNRYYFFLAISLFLLFVYPLFGQESKALLYFESYYQELYPELSNRPLFFSGYTSGSLSLSPNSHVCPYTQEDTSKRNFGHEECPIIKVEIPNKSAIHINPKRIEKLRAKYFIINHSLGNGRSSFIPPRKIWRDMTILLVGNANTIGLSTFVEITIWQAEQNWHFIIEMDNSMLKCIYHRKINPLIGRSTDYPFKCFIPGSNE